jgi:hypothetical protein
MMSFVKPARALRTNESAQPKVNETRFESMDPFRLLATCN